jgi:hypothetical protein
MLARPDLSGIKAAKVQGTRKRPNAHAILEKRELSPQPESVRMRSWESSSMDGTFACPECGFEVEVGGLAPGRQVRCGFCHRLLEVPYLPRAADPSWKRKRFARPRWVPWAWIALGALSVVLLAAGVYRLVSQQYESLQDRSINEIFESSRRHEADGEFAPALIDLDTGLELARKAGSSQERRFESERNRRPELARRDAEQVLKRLLQDDPSSFRLGDWLNLSARTARDTDLAPLITRVNDEFQGALNRQVEFDWKAARAAFNSGDLALSLNYCDQVGGLIDHLAKSVQGGVRRETEQLAAQVCRTRGVLIEAPEGQFLFGARSYVSDFLPVLERALEAKGYVPRRESSPWRELWSQALYHMRLDVSEMQEGNYLSSQNRLTRIEAELTLTTAGGGLVWHTTPTVRSDVPLPKLSAYQASRIAVSSERSEEFERLLYKNARDRIEEKFRHALNNMPSCPDSAIAKSP